MATSKLLPTKKRHSFTTTAVPAPVIEGIASPTVFLAITTFAIAYGIGRSWSGNRGGLPRAIAAGTGIALIASAIHGLAGGALPLAAAPATPAWLLIFIVVAFAALFLFQALLWRASTHPLGQRLYVHALNGFYVGPIANRILRPLWPTQKSL